MKNLLFIIGIVCLTSSFTSSNSKTEFSNLQFDEVYKQGYVVIQGQFKEIDLYFTTINGYFVFSRWVLRDGFEYSAQTRDLPTRGVGGNKRSIPLN